MSPADKSAVVKRLALDGGFDRAGIAPAEPVDRVPYIERWLNMGRAGTMEYLRRHHEIRRDPRGLLDGARSVIVVALNYHQPAPPPSGDGRRRGRVAMYAWGADYHGVMRRKLHALASAMRAAIAGPFDTRCCVDTAPIVERDAAARAGIGWIGKNTMVLHQELGSYFFLGEIVTTLDLAPDAPAVDHCGSCTRCLDACPTRAFPAPYEMDASRCISYLTIEHRTPIDPAFHAQIGDWLFGCDICQQVCPFNREPPVSDSFPIRPPGPEPALDEIAGWTDEDHRRTLKESAMNRATLDMLKRNAGIVSRNLDSAPK